jgi:hypothetical protein
MSLHVVSVYNAVSPTCRVVSAIVLKTLPIEIFPESCV